MTAFTFKTFTLAIAVTAATATLTGQNQAPVIEMQKVTPFEFNGDVRSLPNAASSFSADSVGTRLKSKRAKKTKPDQRAFVSLNAQGGPMPSPDQNFAGLSFSDSVTGGQVGAGWPANANGEVGRNYYVEAVNNAFAIYDKTGTRLAAFTENSLWSSSGSNACNGNSFGDAVVIYDQPADRFILTNFAFARDINGNYLSPFYECIAVAKTSDPVTGGWWLYPLRMDPGGANQPPVSTLNDYAKFGIWTDCLYMSANGFSAPSLDYVGAEYASLSRADLESGAPLTWTLGIINNTTDPFTMIPSNLLGVTLNSMPPPGTPNYFVSQSTTGSSFEVRKFTAGVNCGSGGTLSAPVNVSQTAYTAPSGPLVAQPNTANLLDTLEDRLMQKVQYRKIGSAESLWVVHNVQTSPSAVLTEQWAQIDVTSGTISTTPVQQQIYSPDTTLNRWMGSIAADHDGNVALGFSTSNGTAPNYPSIAYAGRLAGDPLNTLPQTEIQLVAGLGSQRFNCGGAPCDRWGDFSSMSVDPSDDCTFWYANQYYSSQANGDSGNWQTRIGSFKFPSCVSVAPILTISKSHAGNFAQGQNGQMYTITVGNSNGGAPTSGTVTVTDTLPSGLTTTAISGSGWACVLGTLSCTRSDVLAPGTSNPPITLVVNVGTGATSPQTNAASVSGGGSATANTNDPTIILTANASTTTTVGTITLEPSVVNHAYSVAYTIAAVGGTPAGNVSVSDGSASNTCTAAAGACSITSTSTGSKTITVTYLGNGTVAASSSGTTTHTVINGWQTWTSVGGSLQDISPAGGAPAKAALRDSNGGILLSTYASSSLFNSGGSFASDPAIAEDQGGNAFVTARDGSNALWANVFNHGTSTWAGWQFGGGATVGVPAIAVTPSGTSWIAARDAYGSYWLVSYTIGSGYGTWTPLAGVFATDPVIAACGDGSLYVVGKDSFTTMWSGRYIPGTGLQSWVLGGGTVTGNASLTCGTDNAAYMVARDSFNSSWIARIAGNTWTGWFNGGAQTAIDPQIAALGGSEAVVILDAGGSVWRNTFTEGTSVDKELFFVGKATDGLWWWRQTGNQWNWIGNNGVAAGALAAAPR